MTDKFSEINAIAERLAGRVDGTALENLRGRAIASNMSLEAFREASLALLPNVAPVSAPRAPDMSRKDWSRYSLSRAIIGLADKTTDNGFEREISQELERIHGNRTEGLLIPDGAFTRNMVAGTGTLGGMLVQTDNPGGEFIGLLRNKSQVLNLGARVMNLSRPTTIPRQSGASTANWVGETVASTLSGINLTQITLTPKAITAQVQYSKLLLMESDPSIDALLRSDITEQLGLAIDLAALHGTGGTQPTGIIGTSGIGSVLLATNGLSLANSTAYPFLVSLESVVAAANADSNSFAYLMRSNVRGMLKGQSRFSSTDTPVFETVNINGELVGRVNGYKALVSNQIANNLTEGTATTQTTPIFAGCWDDLIVASFGATEIIADQFSAASQRIIKLYAHRFCDVAVRRPQSFCIGSGILGG